MTQGLTSYGALDIVVFSPDYAGHISNTGVT